MLRFTLTGCLAAMLVSTAAYAGDEGHGDMPPPVQVTDAHKVLHLQAGSWEVSSKMWMGPGEPQVSQGTSECRLILGGLGIAYDFTGSMGETPFSGYGSTVLNPTSKKYDAVWYDNYSHNGPSLSSGKWDDAKRTMTEQMVTLDPKGKKIVHDVVTVWESNDKFVSTFYMGKGKKKQRTMELVYVRKR